MNVESGFQKVKLTRSDPDFLLSAQIGPIWSCSEPDPIRSGKNLRYRVINPVTLNPIITLLLTKNWEEKGEVAVARKAWRELWRKRNSNRIQAAIFGYIHYKYVSDSPHHWHLRSCEKWGACRELVETRSTYMCSDIVEYRYRCIYKFSGPAQPIELALWGHLRQHKL